MAHGICPLDGQAATAHGKKKPGILCRAKRLVVLGDSLVGQELVGVNERYL
jgi:hypothetical protein